MLPYLDNIIIERVRDEEKRRKNVEEFPKFVRNRNLTLNE